MSRHNWIRRLFTRHPVAARKHAHHPRLALERFEDRVVPATIWTGTANLLNESGGGTLVSNGFVAEVSGNRLTIQIKGVATISSNNFALGLDDDTNPWGSTGPIPASLNARQSFSSGVSSGDVFPASTGEESLATQYEVLFSGLPSNQTFDLSTNTTTITYTDTTGQNFGDYPYLAVRFAAAITTGTAVNEYTVVGFVQLQSTEIGINVDKVTVAGTAIGDGLTILKDTPIKWRYTVNNTGMVPLSNVTVTDNQTGVTPAYVSGDTNTDGKLDVNETWIFEANGTAIVGDYSNTGTASGSYVGIGGTYPVQDTDDSNYFGADPNFTIDKVADQTLVSSAGTVINYTITVKNTGNIALTGVVVKDKVEGYAEQTLTLDSGDTDNDGELDTTETWTYKASYTVTQADLDGNGGGDGDIDNTATATTTEAGSKSDSETVLLAYNPALAIDKAFVDVTGGNGNALADAAGDVLNYTVKVTNTGNVTLTGVTVVDPLTGQNITGVTLAPGASQTFNTSYVLTQADLDGQGGGDGDVDNTATADSNETGEVSDSAAVPLVYNPALAIDKTGTFGAGENGLADPGELITYTFTVTNTGNVTLTNVTVTDPLVTGITYDSGDDDNDNKLDVGETWTYTATYAVTQADIDAGSVYNLATADSTESPPDDDDHDQTLPQNPAYTIEKSVTAVDAAGNGAADAAGDVIDYKIVLKNIGNVSITGVSLTDSLIAGLTRTGDTGNDNVLSPGEVWTYTGSYDVTQADLDGNGGGDGDIDNTATVTSTQIPDPKSDTETVPLVTNPQIAIDKVTNGSDGPTILVGKPVTWTYTVTNPGNVALANVAVTDNQSGVTPDYVSGDADNDGLLDVNETWIFKATGTATVGNYTNIGTANGTFVETQAEDTDASNYFGANPQIDVEKLVSVDNGANYVDADTGPGPTLLAPTNPKFKFVVKNTGNVTLTDIVLSDSVYDLNGTAPGTTVTIASLAPGGEYELIFTGTWSAGQHTNTATASAVYNDSVGNSATPTDTDAANYFGNQQQVIQPGDFRTQTMGGWGAPPNGNNPGRYLHNNFSSLVGSTGYYGTGGIVINASAYNGKTYTFNTAQKITDFLPAGGSLNIIGQLLALKISIGFDEKIASFGASDNHLKDLVVKNTSSPFYGKTVAWVVAKAEAFLAGGPNGYTASQYTDVLSKINETFVDGNTYTGFLGYSV